MNSLDGFMLTEKPETRSENYQFDIVSRDISVEVARPKHYGEGRAVELAIEILEVRYQQLFGKVYTGRPG